MDVLNGSSCHIAGIEGLLEGHICSVCTLSVSPQKRSLDFRIFCGCLPEVHREATMSPSCSMLTDPD